MRTSHRAAAAAGILLAVALLGGCASARYVVVEPGGGVVAIPGNIPLHRNRALELMASRCPNGYAVGREEEVPIGEVVRGERVIEPDRLSNNKIVTTQEYVVSTRTEWRIHFTCLDRK